jgi:hypothetical protein
MSNLLYGPRGLLAVSIASLMLLAVGCGSSSPTVGQTSASLFTSTTGATTDASTTSNELPPTPAPVATWHFKWPVEGGYRYSGSLSLGSPEHIEENVIAPCSANSSTDAQVRGRVEIANETKGFSGQPILDLETQPQEPSDKIYFGGDDGCQPEGEGGDGIEYNTDHALAPGIKDSFQVALVIPNYYSPEHPDGNPALLGEYKFKATAFKPEGSPLGAGPVHISGPDIESFGPNTVPQFSLGAVARK